MLKNLNALEKKITTEYNYKNANDKEFLKKHYKHFLKLLNPILFKGQIVMNEFQYNLMMHLFNLCSQIKYVPSCFIKQIAEMSSFTTIELVGFPLPIKNQKSTEFLSQYYKIVSIITNNKYIKSDKKKIFEKIVSQKLNEKTVQWLINVFTHPSNELDDKTKILLKAITQTKFEFFEAFAENFKKTLYELINSSNKNKNWINKYVFKIIEKCLIKLPNIEKEFLVNLSKVCHSIIDIFVSKQNSKIKKLYRLSMRLMYIIYDKRNEKNSKIIKFLQLKFIPLISVGLRDDLVTEVLNDFIEVNFYILNKRNDLFEYYQFFYSLILEGKKEENKIIYMKCIEKIFKYEMELRAYQISDIAFIRTLLRDFTSKELFHKKIAINIICLIIQNCPIEMKLKILEEISFSNFSFFSEEVNVPFLEKLINAIAPNVTNEKIYQFYVKYLDLLFTHSINGKFDGLAFLTQLEDLKYNEESIFYLVLNFANKLFFFYQESGYFTTAPPSNSNNDKVVIKILEILARKSAFVKKFDKENFQFLLNVLAYFLIYKIIFYPHIELNSKFKINTLTNQDEFQFIFFLLLFTKNLPEFIFNKNTFLTTPIKIEISPLLLAKVSETKKIRPGEFVDFGESSDMNIVTKLYLLCIYTQFISKFFFLNILFDENGIKANEDLFLSQKIVKDSLTNEKISILSLLNYTTDNIFLCNTKNNDFFNKMFDKFFEKYFAIIKKSYNTLFKQKLLSIDLKQLLNFACYFNSSIRAKSIRLIKTYAKYFPFILNEYEIFEYCVNVLGTLICYSVKHYDFFISEVPLNNFTPLQLPSEKKTVQQIYFELYKIFEKCLQKSHMINNNNITYNISNYMNQYIIDNSLGQSQNEGMNYSVNLLQKIYNNIKKIEIPPMLKTSAYLDPEKFQNYLKTHVKKNFDKYISLSSLNDIYSPSDYAKSTKLQLRNKYIGIIEGKINNLKTEFSNNDDKCYYKFKAETSKKIKKIFNEESDVNIITKKVSPILIELTAFIVYSNMENKNLNPLFKKEIINDELINILTSVPLLLNTANIIETATFCWEWILYLDKSKISLILNNIATLLKNNKNTNKSINQKKKSDIFDLENTLEDSIANAKEEYVQICDNFHKEGNANCSYNQVNNYGRIIELLIISPNKKEKNRYISYDDFINGQIILLKFLKECMNEFCKCDMEKLKLIYDIIKNFVDLKISDNMYNCPLYIYLHFFVLNISLELFEIMETRINLFTFVGDELNEFKILLFLYGLRYFKFDKQRRIIKSKFHLSEIEQTLKNCEEILKSDHKNKKLIKYDKQLQHRKSNLEKVYKFVNLLNSIPNINEKETLNLFENHKELLIFLIDNEMSSLRYWNNPSTSHKNTRDFSEDKIKKMFDSIFKFSNKLCLKLIQRFPWINNKFPLYVNHFGEYIYNNKSKFYQQPLALKVLIDYIVSNKKKDLEDINIMKSLIFWKFPSLNYALKFISLSYTGMIGLHKYCVHMMNHAMTTAIIFYLPQLINSLRTNTHFQVEKFILKKSKASAKIAHQFLWALEVEEVMAPKTNKRYLPKGYVEVLPSNVISQILKVKILKNFNVMQRKFWYDENEIFGKICEVSGCFLHIEGEYSHLSLKMTKQEKTEFVRSELAKIPGKIQPYIYLPTNPNYKILDILPQTAVTLQSAKKVPFIMGFDAMEYPGPDKEALINNMDITSFIENEYSYTTNKAFDGMTHMYAQSSFCRKENNNTNAENYSHGKPNYCFSIEKNVNSMTKSKENLTISDVILEEDNDVTERIIENEKNQGIFVPTFDARILHSKNDFVPNEEDLISNEINENNNNNNNIETKLNNDININNKSVNVLSVIKESMNEEEKASYVDSTKKEIKNPFDSVTDLEEQKNINLLDNCTLSDIELSDGEEGKYQSKVANQNEQSLEKDNNAFKKKNQIINMSCIFKVGDDLRQDSLALQVIQIFQEIFKENNLNLYTYPYQTISTISPKYKDLGGFIEVVKDCDSRDQIGKTYDTNLYDYYICSFGQENSKDFRTARKNLIESLAAYGIISYILQIKDRHNGNILIDKYGHLIHIDFGFIFDISPGGNMKFERAAFKLTKEMLKIMQGTESEAYSTFVDLTVRAFLACRDYMDKLLDPVVLMFSSGLDCFRDNSIQNFINRFKLELNEEEAASYMRELIKTAEDNWRTNVYDFIQKKQNNISY